MSEDRNALRAWLDLLAAANAIEKGLDSMFRREFGLSLSRFDVLSALDRAGKDGLRAGDLTRKLLVTDGATTQVTASLIRDGLVKRTPCPDDGRAAIFTLTRKGEKLFQKMASIHRGWVNDAFIGFTPSQIESLRNLMKKIDLTHIQTLSERKAA